MTEHMSNSRMNRPIEIFTKIWSKPYQYSNYIHCTCKRCMYCGVNDYLEHHNSDELCREGRICSVCRHSKTDTFHYYRTHQTYLQDDSIFSKICTFIKTGLLQSYLWTFMVLMTPFALLKTILIILLNGSIFMTDFLSMKGQIDTFYNNIDLYDIYDSFGRNVFRNTSLFVEYIYHIMYRKASTNIQYADISSIKIVALIIGATVQYYTPITESFLLICISEVFWFWMLLIELDTVMYVICILAITISHLPLVLSLTVFNICVYLLTILEYVVEIPLVRACMYPYVVYPEIDILSRQYEVKNIPIISKEIDIFQILIDYLLLFPSFLIYAAIYSIDMIVIWLFGFSIQKQDIFIRYNMINLTIRIFLFEVTTELSYRFVYFLQKLRTDLREIQNIIYSFVLIITYHLIRSTDVRILKFLDIIRNIIIYLYRKLYKMP